MGCWKGTLAKHVIDILDNTNCTDDKFTWTKYTTQSNFYLERAYIYIYAIYAFTYIYIYIYIYS